MSIISYFKIILLITIKTFKIMDFKQENDSDYSMYYTPIKNRFIDPERSIASAPIASAPIASAPIASAPIASAPIASAPKSTPPAAHEDMCERLIETYNTSIIDYFSQEFQDAFDEEASNCTSYRKNYMRGRKREVLSKLIRNRKNPHTKVDFVGGPFNLTYHWSNKYKKAIYIWGEKHGKTVDCPKSDDYPRLNIVNIEDFLHDIFFINPIAFSDFYLEMQAHVVPYGYPEYEYCADRINILRSCFGNCIGPNRNFYRTCDNSRMHFFDIRLGEVRWGINSACLFENEISSFLSYTNSKLKDHKDTMYQDYPDLSLSDENNVWDEYCYDNSFLEKINNFVDRWKSFLHFFSRFDNDDLNTQLNYKKFWYDQIYNFKLLAKEITVMHTDVKPLLNIFIKKELDKLLPLNYYREMAEHSKYVLYVNKRIRYILYGYHTSSYRFTYNDIKKLLESMYDIFDKVFDFNLLIVDAYLLARIFKTFKIDNPYSYNRRKTDEPAEPHNIVIYAGNAHSKRYRLFLTYLGFNLIKSSGGLEKPEKFTNCVDIRDIDQPFFGKWQDRKDNPLDEKYFGTPDDLYYSFESAFTFLPPAGFIPFDEPNVPYDLFSQVSYNDLQYVQKPKPYKIRHPRW